MSAPASRKQHGRASAGSVRLLDLWSLRSIIIFAAIPRLACGVGLRNFLSCPNVFIVGLRTPAGMSSLKSFRLDPLVNV
jgi:hypothetical protein